MSVVELPADVQRAIAEGEQAQRETLWQSIVGEVVPFLGGNRIIYCPRRDLLVLGTIIAERDRLRAQEAARAVADPIPVRAVPSARARRRRSRRR